jgi:hypothetical protein
MAWLRSLALFVLVLASPTLSAPGHAWVTYHNERYGVQLVYPANVFVRQSTSRAGDGTLLATADNRARLLVGTIENVDEHSPASYQRFLSRHSYRGLKVDYAPVGQTWAVLSGAKGTSMIYEKVMFSCGGQLINSFAMIYPLIERRYFDPIVETVENSFRPGVRGCAQPASFF